MDDGFDVCEYLRRTGAQADRDRPPNLLIEVPHGSTRLAEFFALREFLNGALPDRLEDFFLVNTDAGAPELALRIAEQYVERHPDRSVGVLRSRIPRTFVDCNRVISPGTATPGMTAGIQTYIVEQTDVDLLVALHARYQQQAYAHIDAVCDAGGTALLLHTYAPRSVAADIAPNIAQVLREAWTTPERWTLRPHVDVISRASGAQNAPSLVPDGFLARMQEAFVRIDLRVTDSETYHLHPSTTGREHADRWPGQVACVEVRRDLLTLDYQPFAELAIDSAHVDRIAAAFCQALAA